MLRFLNRPLPGWLTLVLIMCGTAIAGTPTYYGYLTAIAGTSTTTPVTIKAAASQSAALANVQNSSGSTIAGILSNGNFESPQFEAPSGNAYLCPAASCNAGLQVAPSGTVISANGVFQAPAATSLSLCPANSCSNALTVNSVGTITEPALAASQPGTLVCRNAFGSLQACSFPTGTVNLTLGSNCPDGTYCGKASIGTFGALGSEGCDVQYFFSSTYGYGIQAFPIFDGFNSKIWAGFVNHTGSTIPNGDIISATYTCPYFGN